MKQEIERKFILLEEVLNKELDIYEEVVREKLVRENVFKFTPISQFYLNEKNETEIRVRRENNFDFYIQAKSKGDLSRKESILIPITIEAYEDLQVFRKGNIVRKIRHHIPYLQYVIEIDIYIERLEGIKIVEVEFSTEEEAAAFKPLSWFGAEVTKDKRFKNRNLSIISNKKLEELLDEY